MKTGKHEPTPSIDEIIKEAKRLYTMGFNLKNSVWLAIRTLRNRIDDK